MITSPVKLANIMNNLFVSRIVKIQELPPATDAAAHYEGRKSTFSLSSVYPDAVRKVFLQLKNVKSCGVDNIGLYIITHPRGQVSCCHS